MGQHLHLFDKVSQFGDPWHGLYRNALLELPNSTTRALAVTPTGGDCFEVRVPGVGIPINDAADTAAGRTWLNHGLIAGTNRVLYGKALGALSWVYVAANNVAYKATASLSNVGAIDVSFVPLQGTTPTQTIEAIAVVPGVSTNGNLLMHHRIMDISPDGRRVIVSHHYAVNYEYADAISQLDLSGNVPNVTASRTLLYDRTASGAPLNGDEISDNRVTTLTIHQTIKETATNTTTTRDFPMLETALQAGAAFPALPAGYVQESWMVIDSSRSGEFSRKTIIGYLFHGGALVSVKYVYTRTDTAVGWSGEDIAGLRNYHGSSTTGQKIEIGGVSSAAVTQGYTYSGTNNVATQTSGAGDAFYFRYTNRLYGLTEPINVGQPNAYTRYHPPMSPTGQGAGTAVDYNRPWATYQPVHHTVTWHAQGAGQLCYV